MGRYRALIARPGVRPLFSITLVHGGLGSGVIALALVLLVQAEHGSFAVAGGALAAYTAGLAISRPLVGRLVDRRGQSILVPLGCVRAAALGALIWIAAGDRPEAVLLATGALAGASAAPLISSLRALWSDLLPRQSLDAAYALLSVQLEVFFVGGPLVAAGLAAAFSPGVALGFGAAVELVTVIAFTRTAAARAWRGHLVDTPRPRLLRARGLIVLLAAAVPYGVVFGALEVAVPAFAVEHGDPEAAGLALSALAIGSLAGGLVYGQVTWRGSPVRRWIALLLALALLLAPVTFSSSMTVAVALLLVGGLAVAPVSAVLYSLLDGVAPVGATVEATTWVLSATIAGGAVGSTLAGVVVETLGVQPALALGSLAAAVSFAVALAGRHRLTPSLSGPSDAFPGVGPAGPMPAGRPVDRPSVR